MKLLKVGGWISPPPPEIRNRTSVRAWLTCKCVCVCVCVLGYTHIPTCICIHVTVYMYYVLHVCVHNHVYTYMNMCVDMCVYVYICIYIHPYKYAYINSNMYLTYIHVLGIHMYLYDVRTNRSVLRTAWRSRARLSCARPPSSTAVRSISIRRNIRLYIQSVYWLIHYVCRCIYICVYIGLEAVSPLFWAAVLAFSAGTELYATKIQKRCERAFMYMNACVCVRACRSVFGACVRACVRVLVMCARECTSPRPLQGL